MNRKWSQHITKGSRALDLDQDVFTWKDPVKIAWSLKRSAETSLRIFREAVTLQAMERCKKEEAEFRKHRIVNL